MTTLAYQPRATLGSRIRATDIACGVLWIIFAGVTIGLGGLW